MPRTKRPNYGIPEGITKQHVERAAAEIDRHDVPPSRRSDRFDVIVGSESYPPKYVISIAAKYAFRTELSSSCFHAHQAVRYLRALGYKIIDRLVFTEQVIAIEDDESAFPEGQELYRLHREHERDSSIPRAAKKKRLSEFGKLECDVCGFDFLRVYGDLGEGFTEAHHTMPVSQLDGTAKTKFADLMLVCSNCHRMLHRGELLTVTELREIVLANARE